MNISRCLFLASAVVSLPLTFTMLSSYCSSTRIGFHFCFGLFLLSESLMIYQLAIMFVLGLFPELYSVRKKEVQRYCFETEYDGYNIEAVHTKIPRCEADAI